MAEKFINIIIIVAFNGREVIFYDDQGLADFFGEDELVQAFSNVHQLVCSHLLPPLDIPEM